MSVTIKMTGTPGSLWLNLPKIMQNINQQSNCLFFTIYGRNPSFYSIHISQHSPSVKLSTKLQSVKTIPPDFQHGDKVWLASKNIKTTRPTKKLLERCLGPFEVLKKVGSHAYYLKFPFQWTSVHPVFHVSLLEPVKQESTPNLNQFPPPPILVEEQEEWELAQFLDSNLKRGKLWYLVEWKGFSEDPEQTMWEPASSLTNFPDAVKNFHPFYCEKPVLNTSRGLFMVLGGDLIL
ncbi:hypothetical protein O181_006212 [Austropuccinia psidii MF-1]|uniref:Chromo domain-containing protein n=1 Tax=Austropuccinia psidii MF-1 TaxID=1389203 RepID=A0A9Q3GHE2_9BASI|nr:hypothetical protein [Austropuccinia psidii MF-1]